MYESLFGTACVVIFVLAGVTTALYSNLTDKEKENSEYLEKFQALQKILNSLNSNKWNGLSVSLAIHHDEKTMELEFKNAFQKEHYLVNANQKIIKL